MKGLTFLKSKVATSVAILGITFVLTLMPKYATASPFIGYELEYVGYACDGSGTCYQSWVVKYYVFGIRVKTDYVIEQCYE